MKLTPRIYQTEALAPDVNHLLADLVLPGHFGNRHLVRLPQDLDHLLFGESARLHGLLARGRAVVAAHRGVPQNFAVSPGCCATACIANSMHASTTASPDGDIKKCRNFRRITICNKLRVASAQQHRR